jgi:hypothetical protein
MMIPIPSEIAEKAINTFRGMPALLALLLINTIFLVILSWLLWTSAEYRFKEREGLVRMIDRCMVEKRGT